jgi:hypothetical protein
LHISEFLGVYDIDRGRRAEVAYVVGHLLGTRNCALRDVTHSTMRRKPEWDEMVRNLGVPFTLRHRDEMPAEVTQALGDHALPAVLGRFGSSMGVLLPAEDVALANGSVTELETLLRLKAHGAEEDLD